MEDAGILEVVRDEPVHVELLLKQGGGRFRVKPDPARPFVVQAGDVVVTVVGTEFTVAIDPDEVRVSVDHGIVEVERRSGEPRRLLAGESWSTRTEPKHAEAPTSANADEPIVAEAPPSVSATASTNARSLFESANAARRAGNVQLAAQLYRDLVSRFPDDPRAKLAAFELGRLELELGRSDDAEKSLERAASGKAGSAVHEDALAKLVRLYDGRGDQAACRRARDQYLATYPSGVHADSVRKSCSGP
jgi:TolA-binding protein